MLGAMVIDDNGEVWPVGAPRLRELAMCADPDVDVLAYAVRNLGYVLLRRQGRVVRAEMRTKLVKPATLIGLYYCLIDLNPQQILLSRLDDEGSRHEFFDDVSEFAATIERGSRMTACDGTGPSTPCRRARCASSSARATRALRR